MNHSTIQHGAIIMDFLSKSERNDAIERLHVGGATKAALARQFGLSPTRIGHILARMRRTRLTIKARLDAPLRRVK